MKPGRFERVRRDTGWTLRLHDSEGRIVFETFPLSEAEDAEGVVDTIMATCLATPVDGYMKLLRIPVQESDEREIVRRRRVLIAPDRSTRDAWAERHDLRRHQYATIHTPDQLRGLRNAAVVFLGWPKTWSDVDREEARMNVRLSDRGGGDLVNGCSEDFWGETD